MSRIVRLALGVDGFEKTVGFRSALAIIFVEKIFALRQQTLQRPVLINALLPTMEPRSIDDLFSGAALAAFGLYVIIESARFSYSSEDGPGPGFLPFWLGIAIITLALCLILVNQLRPKSKPLDGPRSWSGASRALTGWLGLMGAVALFPFLGFTICLVLLTLYIMALMERRSLSSAILVALGLGVGFHLIFVVALGLSLPKSPLGF